ncbi:hypothetical protein Tco_0039515 [Tanacetum coccineum]
MHANQCLTEPDLTSWQQRIRCLVGKVRRRNIMKSITERSFQMGTLYKLLLKMLKKLRNWAHSTEHVTTKAVLRIRGILQRNKMLLLNSSENGAVLDEEQLLFLTGEQVTNFDDDVFEVDQCDAFDSDVDEAPTTQTIFMVNLSSEDPI